MQYCGGQGAPIRKTSRWVSSGKPGSKEDGLLLLDCSNCVPDCACASVPRPVGLQHTARKLQGLPQNARDLRGNDIHDTCDPPHRIILRAIGLCTNDRARMVNCTAWRYRAPMPRS